MSSEMGDMWREIRKEVSEKRDKNWETNLSALKKTSFQFEVKEISRVILFREHASLKVDYYPSSGKWKLNNKFYYGDIKSFINLYTKKRKEAK